MAGGRVKKYRHNGFYSQSEQWRDRNRGRRRVAGRRASRREAWHGVAASDCAEAGRGEVSGRESGAHRARFDAQQAVGQRKALHAGLVARCLFMFL